MEAGYIIRQMIVDRTIVTFQTHSLKICELYDVDFDGDDNLD
jgi:hypothetical protein